MRFLYLAVPEAVLKVRMERRKNHYMPPSLLDSQLAALEAPHADEAALAFDVALSPQQIADVIAFLLTQ